MYIFGCLIKARICPQTIFHSLFIGNVPYLCFAFCAVIDGIEYKTGMGTTKKEARHRAAELALQDVVPTLENRSPELDAPG